MTTRNDFGLQHLTPILVVDAVEPCLHFWTGKLGFTAENQVPGDDGQLVFASAKAGDVEVMYQTRASVLAERPEAADELVGHSTVLFIAVDDLDKIEVAVSGAPMVKPRHDTFYGTAELYVKEPGGNVVGFAQFKRSSLPQALRDADWGLHGTARPIRAPGLACGSDVRNSADLSDAGDAGAGRECARTAVDFSDRAHHQPPIGYVNAPRSSGSSLISTATPVAASTT